MGGEHKTRLDEIKRRQHGNEIKTVKIGNFVHVYPEMNGKA